MREFVFRSEIVCSADELFAWHDSQDALAKLTPGWLPVSVRPGDHGLVDGSQVVLRLGSDALGMDWVARIGDVRRGEGFVDTQQSGPFRSWRHSHNFIARSPRSTVLEDRIQYSLPFNLEHAVGWLVELQLKLLFNFRHAVTKSALSSRSSK